MSTILKVFETGVSFNSAQDHTCTPAFQIAVALQQCVQYSHSSEAPPTEATRPASVESHSSKVSVSFLSFPLSKGCGGGGYILPGKATEATAMRATPQVLEVSRRSSLPSERVLLRSLSGQTHDSKNQSVSS